MTEDGAERTEERAETEKRKEGGESSAERERADGRELATETRRWSHRRCRPRQKIKKKKKNNTNKKTMKIKHIAAGAIVYKKGASAEKRRGGIRSRLASALWRGSPGWVGSPFLTPHLGKGRLWRE